MSKKNDSDNIFNSYRKILRLMGVTITDHSHEKRSIFIQIYFATVMTLMSANCLFCFMSIFTPGALMSDRSISLVCFLNCFSAVFKLGILQSRSYELRYLFDALNTPGAARSTWVLRKTYSISSVYTTCIITLASGWCAYPFLVKEVKLPIPYWLPMEDATLRQKLFIFSFVTSTMLFACGTHESADTLLLMIAAQICRRFDTVNETLIGLGQYNTLAKDKYDKDKMLDKVDFGLMITKNSKMNLDEIILKECIREHVDVIKLVRHFDEVLDIIFFVQVIQSTIVSVMTFFSVMQVESLYDEFPKFATIISSTYLQFYMYCWLGEEISFHSDDLHKAVYSSQWYKCNQRVMKSIAIMETFTKTHFKLEGGHMFQMGLHTFLLVLEQSFSYLMVLRAVTRKLSVKSN